MKMFCQQLILGYDNDAQNQEKLLELGHLSVSVIALYPPKK
jgi:hypothetical protein